MSKIYQKSFLFEKNPVKCKNGGFTLIELLVVVLIIGILAAIALPQYNVAVSKSRFVQLQVLGDALYKAEDLYYLTNGEYTNDFSNLSIGIPGTVSADGTEITQGKWNCQLRLTEGLHDIRCSYGVHDRDVPTYVRVFGKTISYCRSYAGDDSVSDRVCRSLGGTDKICSSGYGYCEYVLP